MCRYIIVGKAASGKDWCQKMFVENGYKPLKQYTTRPKRPNETGDEYHFVSKKRIENLKEKQQFASLKIFKDWYYGFTIDEFKNCDVAILSVGNICDLRNWYPEVLITCTIIYLDIPISVRKERLKTRYNGGNQDDSVERRLTADERDFKNFKYFDLKFSSNNEATEFINKIIQQERSKEI